MINFKKRSKSICEFCKEEFIPFSHIKNPRACNKLKCQKKRQRVNEKEWREKNKERLPDAKYHRIMREKRLEKLNKIAASIYEAIKVGNTYLKKNLKISYLKDILEKFIFSLGIKLANKLLKAPEDALGGVFGCL